MAGLRRAGCQEQGAGSGVPPEVGWSCQSTGLGSPRLGALPGSWLRQARIKLSWNNKALAHEGYGFSRRDFRASPAWSPARGAHNA